MVTVISVLQIAVLVTTVYAFVHAAMQRPDAYTAADKLTKPVWLVILGVAAALTLLSCICVFRCYGRRDRRPCTAPPACIWSTCGPNFSTFRVSRASGMKALLARARRRCLSAWCAGYRQVPLPLADPATGEAAPTNSSVFLAVCRSHRMDAMGRRPDQPAGVSDAVRPSGRQRRASGTAAAADEGLGRGARAVAGRRHRQAACARSSSATGRFAELAQPGKRPAGTSSRGGLRRRRRRNASRPAATPGGPEEPFLVASQPTRAQLAALVDHTLLKLRGPPRPATSSALVAEAADLGVYAVCVSPSMVPVARLRSRRRRRAGCGGGRFSVGQARVGRQGAGGRAGRGIRCQRDRHGHRRWRRARR